MTNENPNAPPKTPPTQKRLIKRLVKMAKPAAASSSRQWAGEREQSTIQFPYLDLENAITVASAILRGGGVAVTRDQLAGTMGASPVSGNFVTKIASARTFGLVKFENSKYELTDTGFNILDSDEARQKSARRDAFLTVPLYRRAFDEFKGRQLPPRPHGLEQAFVKFGVAQKQKTNARLAFDKSAMQAGFFINGPDRLIEPIIGGVAPANHQLVANDFSVGGDGGSAPVEAPSIPRGLPPFIQGLLEKLPEPNTNWAVEGRAKWLQTAANIFDLMYKGSGEISITAKSEEPPK